MKIRNLTENTNNLVEKRKLQLKDANITRPMGWHSQLSPGTSGGDAGGGACESMEDSIDEGKKTKGMINKGDPAYNAKAFNHMMSGGDSSSSGECCGGESLEESNYSSNYEELINTLNPVDTEVHYTMAWRDARDLLNTAKGHQIIDFIRLYFDCNSEDELNQIAQKARKFGEVKTITGPNRDEYRFKKNGCNSFINIRPNFSSISSNESLTEAPDGEQNALKTFEVSFSDRLNNSSKRIKIKAHNMDDAWEKVYAMPETRNRYYDNVMVGEYIEGGASYGCEVATQGYWNGKPDNHRGREYIFFTAKDESQVRRYVNTHLISKFYKGYQFRLGKDQVWDEPKEEGQSGKFVKILDIYQTGYAGSGKDITNESLEEKKSKKRMINGGDPEYNRQMWNHMMGSGDMPSPPKGSSKLIGGSSDDGTIGAVSSAGVGTSASGGMGESIKGGLTEKKNYCDYMDCIDSGYDDSGRPWLDVKLELTKKFTDKGYKNVKVQKVRSDCKGLRMYMVYADKNLTESSDNNGWEEILDMQGEDGTPTGYSKKLSNGKFVWATLFPEGWKVETEIGKDFVPVKNKKGKELVFKSFNSLKSWVNHNEKQIFSDEAKEDVKESFSLEESLFK